MKRGDVSVREIDDIGDAVLSAAEIKAIASGNPLVMEKVKLEAELQKLEAAEAADRANRVRMRRRLADGELERAQLERRLPFLAAARVQAQATHGEKEFKAAILQGILGNEATAYTKREAAGEAVLKVIGELDALALQQRERQIRTIGRYRGFLLRGNAYTMGAADLSVCFEHEEQIRALSATSTALKTPIGVFASIDRQLQGIGEEIARSERRLTELAQDDAKVQAMLAAPWPQTTELAEQRARLERINEQLDQSEHENTITPLAPVILDSEQGAGAGDLVVVGESDEYIAPEGDAAAMEQPIVLLPEPSDPEAMAAAIRALSAAAEPEPIEVAEEADDVLELPTPTLEIPAVVEAEPLAVAPVTIDEIVAIALSQPAIPVAPKPVAPKVLPIFGQPLAPRRRTAAKQVALAPIGDGTQLDLFPAPPLAPSSLQASLW